VATAARPQALSLAWLRRNEPEVYAHTHVLCMASSFIAYRLTGEYGLDHHSASQCDPHYDLHEHRWIDEWAGGVVDQSIVIHLLQVRAERAPQVTRGLWFHGQTGVQPASQIGQGAATVGRDEGQAGVPVDVGGRIKVRVDVDNYAARSPCGAVAMTPVSGPSPGHGSERFQAASKVPIWWLVARSMIHFIFS
jgi:hypothetical protein